MSLTLVGQRQADVPMQVLLDLARATDPGVLPVLTEVRRSDVGGSPYTLHDPGAPLDLSARLGPRDVLILYIPGRSTGGVEVSRPKGEPFHLRCLSFSTDADYDLAWSLAQQMTHLLGVPFVTDVGKAVDGPPTGDWRQEHRAATFKRLAAVFARQGTSFLQTPVRPFWAGPRVWQAANRKVDRFTQMVTDLVRVGSGYRVSGVETPARVQVRPVKRSFGIFRRRQVVEAEQCLLERPCLVAEAQRILLALEDTRWILLWNDFIRVADPWLTWLDDRQAVLRLPRGGEETFVEEVSRAAESQYQAPASSVGAT
ncbi:MAG: hypothetical protein WBV82_00430 [Myxococcaceae bacterium]